VAAPLELTIEGAGAWSCAGAASIAANNATANERIAAFICA
jgi:hypothetical protein